MLFRSKGGVCPVNVVDPALETLDGQDGVVAVGLGLGGNGELRHLKRGLIADDSFAGTADVEYERVFSGCGMVDGMDSVSGAASVEALEADIQPSRVILARDG